MAVVQRQERGARYKCFSSRLRPELYDELNDWAWEHRLSLAAASALLLVKALEAEKGGQYISESEVGKGGSKSD